MSVRYLVDGVDVTAGVGAGTYETASLSPGASAAMRVLVTVAPGTATGLVKRVVVSQISATEPSRLDVVRAVTTT